MTNTAPGAVLRFPNTGCWAQIDSGGWSRAVSTGAATFEAWIRTTTPDSQTIVLGSNDPGATPRLSVGGDRLAVYWDTSGQGGGWTSADTRPVTDGQWHHVAVVFDQGAMTFYKDGSPTADQLSVPSPQQAAGALQLGSGFGSTTGFVGDLYDVRVWSVARTAEQVNSARWALPAGTEPGLTVATSFGVSGNSITNLADGSVSRPSGASVVAGDVPAPTYALSLGGGNSGVEMGAKDLGVASNAATLECWMRVPSTGAATSAQSLMWLTVDPVESASLDYLGGDQLGVSLGGRSYPSADTRVISDGNWHHVAVVISNWVVTFYKDGVATADTIQLPSTGEVEIGIFVDAGVGTPQESSPLPEAFSGELYDLRVWGTARTTAQVSGYRYVPLTGSEPGLKTLVGFSGTTVVNLAESSAEPGTYGSVSVVIPDQLPQQALPTNVWTFPTPGESPVAPSLSAQGGTLCIQNTSTDSYLHCVDLETGQTSWTYDPAAAEGGSYPTSIIPWSVTVSGQTALLEVQQQVSSSTKTVTFAEIHMVDLTTGTLVGVLPTVISGAWQLLTRPVVANGTVFVGYTAGGQTGGPKETVLAWATVNDRLLEFTSQYWLLEDHQMVVASAMTTPVADAANVYVATTVGASSWVTAIPFGSEDPAAATWETPPLAPVTANPVLSGDTLFIPAGGTMLAVSTANGAEVWSHRLSSAPVTATPVVIGSTLYVGSTDGTLYALDAATGNELWRVDTGSPINTDLVSEMGLLYFANAGVADTGPAPAFLAVDTTSQGQDILTYPVPGADTILVDRAGVSNGVAYFYGAANVYAVNMANVAHEFSVDSKLIVEDYDTSGAGTTPKAAVGNNTTYRVTLAVKDENGFPRVNQVVKLWSAGPLHVINQGAAVTLTPDQPVWMATDSSGNLTLALSAYDSGTPDGNPNVACPALFAWSNFMPAGEAIVIYPDHESLTSLSSVQGPDSSVDRAAVGGDRAPLTLGAATDYKGDSLIASHYTDADSLTAIASTIRNTVGTRNPASVGAAPGLGAQRYVKAGVVRNVHYATNPAAAGTRPYYPGADQIFTMDLSDTSVTPSYSTSYDDSRPAGYNPVQDTSDVIGAPASIGSIFHHIEDYATNVVKGAEQVGKMAWKFTEGAVMTVIHTVENEYDLVISTLEDAITAVTGFFKAVVADVRKVVEWLSAMFNWDHILTNHTWLKNTLNNGSTGIFDRLQTWLNGELKGTSTDLTSTLTALSPTASANVGSTAQSTAGQTVQTQQAGNSDPNAVYNQQGQNNANQCTWMQQKTNENAAGGSAGGAVALDAAAFDPTAILTALTTFLTSAEAALHNPEFQSLPGDLEAAVRALKDSFSDPKALLSTALPDLMKAFEDLAKGLVDFANALAGDLLKLLAALLEQVVDFLAQPINIPFVSDLYRLITGDQLSLLDLICLLAAVPMTILLEVITGAPTVPTATVSLPPGSALALGREQLGMSAEEAGLIVTGVVSFILGEIGAVMDTYLLGIEVRGSRMPSFLTLVNYLDFGVDFVGYGFQMVSAYGWASWEAHDWVFWGVQGAPQALNFAYLFRDDADSEQQAGRDIFFGALFLVFSGMYADIWPSSYRNAPTATGLVISANVFGNVQAITEIIQIDDVENMPVEAVIKMVLYTVGNVLSLTGNMLNAAHPAPPSAAAPGRGTEKRKGLSEPGSGSCPGGCPPRWGV
jgi:outer membrane protein assembly factor BamB